MNARRLRRLGSVLDDECGRRIPEERGTPGDHLVEDAAERVDVRPRVERLALALLGGHVDRRPEHHPAHRQVRSAREIGSVLSKLGHAEIQNLDEDRAVARRFEEDVVGLQIAMDDAFGVSCVNGRTDLAHDVDGRTDWQLRAVLDLDPESASLEELHHKVGAAFLDDSEVVDRDDVRVLQSRDGERFPLEALRDDCVLQEVAADDFQRDGSLEVHLRRAIHGAHAATAVQGVDPIFAVKNLADEIVRRRQRGAVVRTELHRISVLTGAKQTVAHAEDLRDKNDGWMDRPCAETLGKVTPGGRVASTAQSPDPGLALPRRTHRRKTASHRSQQAAEGPCKARSRMREINIPDFEYAEALPARRSAPCVTEDLPVTASSDLPADPAVRSCRRRVNESAIGRLASAIEKVRELRGRFADLEAMRRRLESVRNRGSIRIALAERDIETAREVGRDFCAARISHEVDCLRDETVETEALLDEVELVARSLEIEKRQLTLELLECSSVVDRLPTEPDRSRARRIVDDALRRLGVTRTAGGQTLTRGDTKQYGQAR